VVTRFRRAANASCESGHLVASMSGAEWPELCKCCDNPMDCCMATCCSCVMAGQNAEKSQTGSCAKVGGIQGLGIAIIVIASLFPLIPGVKQHAEIDWSTMTFTEADETRNLIVDIIDYALTIIGALVIDVCRYIYRQKIANKYSIQFGFWPDYALVCCCPQCSLVQEKVVVDNGGAKQGAAAGGNTVIGQAVGAGS